MRHPIEPDNNVWSSRAKLAFSVLAIIAAFFFLAEHRAHVLPYLPWLFLALCPLMHFFMHGDHGRHDDHGQRDRNSPVDADNRASDSKPDSLRAGDGTSRGAGHQHHGGRS